MLHESGLLADLQLNMQGFPSGVYSLYGHLTCWLLLGVPQLLLERISLVISSMSAVRVRVEWAVSFLEEFKNTFAASWPVLHYCYSSQ